MYVPKHFAVDDTDECLALMQAHPLEIGRAHV